MTAYLASNPASSLEKMISALVGQVASDDFVLQLTSPRQLTTREVLDGDPSKLAAVKSEDISPEDILWALSGALEKVRGMSIASGSDLQSEDLKTLANIMIFIGHVRADMRLSFVYLLIRQCSVFTKIPEALNLLEDRDLAAKIERQVLGMLENE